VKHSETQCNETIGKKVMLIYLEGKSSYFAHLHGQGILTHFPITWSYLSVDIIVPIYITSDKVSTQPPIPEKAPLSLDAKVTLPSALGLGPTLVPRTNSTAAQTKTQKNKYSRLPTSVPTLATDIPLALPVVPAPTKRSK
jgi:hypothetical protein